MERGLVASCHSGESKFGTHRFCGKTCAAQAATKPAVQKQSKAKPLAGNSGRHNAAPVPQKAVQLCDYCGQKPKCSNFDYCGRSCATLANSTQSKQPITQGWSATKQKTTGVPSASKNIPAPVPQVKPARAPQAKSPVPQDDFSEEEDEEGDEEDEEADTDPSAYPSDLDSEEESAAPAPAVAQPPTKNMPRGKPSGHQKTSPGTCAIPGCGQLSHVDRNGAKTDYCSLKHREKSVMLGLEAACIMCQRYPQSTLDYFCSSACRNQSMAKT
ncbi:hypothetical protein PAXRUDRAFT_31380 [Paxillus rubicundulus Ve08.2h10]|uniref:Unplaced genomic scaffold scaffold_83, whole genome shotgun sequence n=1 Tax=Paxillus rubicundulus Ve08.2h10 TaxID=930991 RepID=A0A0D0E810_9AGAM|nr:hypothetical protein PAXRUDRAFT_31380 [Paxillus rubicundulus Ve08.2h10]